MKGIILAGGRGTRLHPVTLGLCKQLLPIYDKPMIYYPLSVLMQAGIRDILIISTPEDLPRFERIFGDGFQYGLKFSYLPQHQPEGIAQAFLIGEKFIGEDNVALILGDNIFYGHALPEILSTCKDLESGAIIFGYEVKDPERYGIVEFDRQMKVTGIVEKPHHPASRYAVTGLYFYDNDVVSIARDLKPSNRFEYEITDVNMAYLKRGDLHLRIFERGFAWLDTGTHEALQQASSYVQTIQMRQGIKIACIEEIAYRMGYIDSSRLRRFAEQYAKSEYGSYLSELAGEPSIVECCSEH